MPDEKMPNLLTREQMEQNDFVDTEIEAFLDRMNPTDKKIEWDAEDIEYVRDILIKLMERHGISEMEFYPYG